MVGSFQVSSRGFSVKVGEKNKVSHHVSISQNLRLNYNRGALYFLKDFYLGISKWNDLAFLWNDLICGTI